MAKLHGSRLRGCAFLYASALPVALSDLIRDNRLMWTYCRDCGRESDLDPSTVPLPPDYPVPQVGKRMRCTRCGSRRIKTKPELYPGSVRARPLY